MGRSKIGLLLGVMLVFLGAMPAMATVVNDPWNASWSGDELNLNEIVNALYGTSYGSSADMSFAQVVAPLDEVFEGTNYIRTEARYAGGEQTFGWYQPTGSGPVIQNELYMVSGSGLAATGAANISPVGEFGFYNQAGPLSDLDRYTWYSEAARNTGGQDHSVLYDLSMLVGSDYNGRFLMGWEDKPLNLGDSDFQDHVLELQAVVPEPASMSLMGIGIAGMAAGAVRRRFKK